MRTDTTTNEDMATFLESRNWIPAGPKGRWKRFGHGMIPVEIEKAYTHQKEMDAMPKDDRRMGWAS